MNERDYCYMSRCLELASKAYRSVAPNPMVGSVVVHNDIIIGEGFHQKYGAPHAEPMAIEAVKDKSLLKKSTLYVNLEPCSHYGKTPPCAELIVNKGIKRVVIGALDPNPKVAGKGVKILRDAGVEVVVGVLEKESRYINRRFYSYHEKKRPYIIIKWAQTKNGYMDKKREDLEQGALKISTTLTQQLTHKIRSENMAIMVSTNTVLMDDPSLTLRFWNGNHPVRVVLDRKGRLMNKHKLFDQQIETVVLTQAKKADKHNLKYVAVPNDFYDLKNIYHTLYELNIHSVLIEGGASLLTSIIEAGYWDEANVEIADFEITDGVKAPQINKQIKFSESVYDNHRWISYRNSMPF